MIKVEEPANDFRVVFMGTPEFAVTSLKALLNAGINIVAVITAPDKPQGRGQIMHESHVKTFARLNSIPVLTPAKLKDESFLSELKSFGADLYVVVAFRMLPEVVWNMPPKGTINLHASLLPDYRGAAPINWAIINGEARTGVTTFFIEKEIDTGKIVFSENVDITPTDNAGSLHDKLMTVGANLLVKTVIAIKDGNIKIIDQSDIKSNGILKVAPKIMKEDCRINWQDDIDKIHNFIRGLSPYPAAWTVLSNVDNTQQLNMKIFEARKEPLVSGMPEQPDMFPGKLFTDDKKYLKVFVKGGYLSITNIQLEGRKRLDIEDFLRGFKNIGEFEVR